jgi:hypothetical protein
VILSERDTPPVVVALRPDFPDTLHQNWVPEGVPFSLCIDDRPWQEARSLYTPAELLHRIMKWFERAGRGELHDPRQPLDPFFLGQGLHIVAPRNVFDLGPQARAELIGSAYDPANPKVIIVSPRQEGQQGSQRGAFIFVALKIVPQQMTRIGRDRGNLGSLARELSSRGISLLDDLAARVLVWSAGGGNSEARLGSRLGILLEMPIVGPDGASAGATDNVAFLTLGTIGEIGIALGLLARSPSDLKGGARYTRLLPRAAVDNAALNTIGLLMGMAHVEFDRERAMQLAGHASPMPRRIVQVGAGAIGSMVAESLVREGLGVHWTVIDPDDLLPHNLARHTLGIFDVSAPKAVNLAHRLRGLRADVAAEPIVADVLNPGARHQAIIAALKCADLVIDAGASVPVARFLSDHEGSARRASVFFNPAGMSVVLMLESRDRDTNLRMLEAAYYGEVLRVPQLHDHLTESTGLIPYAGACRAVTSRIPASRAQALSGLAAAGLMGALAKAESSLKVSSLAGNGAVAVHDLAMEEFRSVPVLGWTVTLPRVLEDRILEMRTAKLPAETGGVLFGVVDLVGAWPEPADSRGTETEFVRGTMGLRQAVEEAIGKTLDQVRYVGEWHSHPRRARIRPSGTDLNQIAWLTSTLSMDGCPGLMLIAGDGGVSINLGAVIKCEAAAP